MSIFTRDELAYLVGERRLARIATVGNDGTPHVVPVGWSYNADEGAIDISGLHLGKDHEVPRRPTPRARGPRNRRHRKRRSLARARRRDTRPRRDPQRTPGTDPHPPRTRRVLGPRERRHRQAPRPASYPPAPRAERASALAPAGRSRRTTCASVRDPCADACFRLGKASVSTQCADTTGLVLSSDEISRGDSCGSGTAALRSSALRGPRAARPSPG
jgi:Pyridoxamine 5'-phosphate oxidase